MDTNYFHCFAVSVALMGGFAPLGSAQTDLPVAGLPPEGPRDFSSFATLVMKSPFVMPSEGGDQSPISQRYQLTGAARIGDVPHVFLLDVVNQTRFMISPDQGEGEVSLVSFDSDTDPGNTRATIRVGDETGVVSFAKSQLAAPPPIAENATSNPPAAPSALPPAVSGTTTNSAPASTLRPPTTEELQQLGTTAPTGALQPAPPRRIIRKAAPVPLPTNGQTPPTP